MAGAICCATCGDILAAFGFGGPIDLPNCPGYGKHPEPQRMEKELGKGLFLVQSTPVEIPWAVSAWYEYRGPKNRKSLMRAIQTLTQKNPHERGIVVEGDWVWFDSASDVIGYLLGRMKLSGEGLKHFES